ncbi:MAG: circularly permuted type 2 ATP-grasp protein, partial [Gammaproteobacteria bacterium]|nr:circularly permuted type 2 ATP-grasp protein [Gammaproteobacteria bacterium]
MRIDWKSYNPGAFYDELISSPGHARKPGRILAKYLGSLKSEDLQQRKAAAELAIKAMGISFTVYSEAGNIDREWPFDIIPRIITETQWRQTSKGLEQRLRALNCFIHDIYNDQKILKDKVVPAELI